MNDPTDNSNHFIGSVQDCGNSSVLAMGVITVFHKAIIL